MVRELCSRSIRPLELLKEPTATSKGSDASEDDESTSKVDETKPEESAKDALGDGNKQEHVVPKSSATSNTQKDQPQVVSTFMTPSSRLPNHHTRVVHGRLCYVLVHHHNLDPPVRENCKREESVRIDKNKP